LALPATPESAVFDGPKGHKNVYGRRFQGGFSAMLNLPLPSKCRFRLRLWVDAKKLSKIRIK
jgi:hypothetical protein